MSKNFQLLFVLASLNTICSAQTITQTFGTGANTFTMDFVTIGNPGNAADTTGSPNPAGSVAYVYNMGMYEVSRGQIEKANAAGSLGISLEDMTILGGNGVNRPATGVSWYEAANYVNWLNTSTGGTAAYKFVGGTFQLWSAGDAGYNANNMFRNSLAKYVIASRDEWYKAAYGNLNGTWNNYATGSDSAPAAIASGTSGAVYNGQRGPADITRAGGLSPYQTRGQGGNVFEWVETAFDGSNNTAGENRELRGGHFDSGSGTLLASNRYDGTSLESTIPHMIGFRVASVPEPSSLSLLAIGLGILFRRSRKRD